MRLRILVSALLCGTVAIAQDVPKAEAFFGYNYVRMNPGTEDLPSFHSHGTSAQVAVKLNKWVSGVADFGAYNNGRINGVNIDNTVFSFLFGPRVSIRNQSRVTPYFNFLFGGAHATASKAVSVILPVPSQPAVPRRFESSETGFAMALGGGLDIRLNRYISLRPFALDYFLTRLQNPVSLDDKNLNNLRFSAGFNFTFGGEAPSVPPPPPPPAAAMRSCWDGTSIPMDQECPKRRMSLGISSPRAEAPPRGDLATYARG